MAMVVVNGGALTPWPVVPGAGSLIEEGTHLIEGGVGKISLVPPREGGAPGHRFQFPPQLRPIRARGTGEPLSPPRDHGGRVPTRLWVATTLAPLPGHLGEDSLLSAGFPNTHYSLLFWHLVLCTVPISSGIKVSLLRTSVLWTYSRLP